jgi:hypothetical protein
MRHRLAALGAALLATLPISLAAQTFQGKIRFRTVQVTVTEDDARPEALFDAAVGSLIRREGAEVSEATLLINGKRLRTEVANEEGAAYTVWDIERDLLWLVNPAERFYMELPVESSSAAAAPDPSLKLRALGQTRTINGMRAAGYEVRGEDFVIRAWMTQDHPGLTWAFRKVAGRDEGGDNPIDAAGGLLSRHGFPVLLQTLTAGNLELEETVSVERAPLGDAPFRVPAGFKKRELPGGP